MRRTRALALLSILLLAAPGWCGAAEGPLKVFVLGGTSNMRGRPAKVENLPDDLKDTLTEVLVFQEGTWAPLEAGKNLVGNEAAFGRAMSRHLGEPVGIVWVTVASASSPPVGEQIARIARQSEMRGRPIVIAGMLLDVSFRDGLNEERAKNYKDDLPRWIAATRDQIGDARLPIVMNRAIPPVPRTPYLEVVRQAQDSLKLPHFRVFDCDDVPRGSDNVHFDTAGRLEMGKRFAAEMIELMEERKKAK